MNTRAGFTLIELLVSIAIVTMIMSMVLYNYGTFNDNLALSGGAQEVAIAIRQAQAYGLNVAESSVGSGQFTKAYGVFFDPTDNTHYTIFVDSNTNKKYDVGNGCGSGSTECVTQFVLRNNVTISTICDSASCPPAGVQNLNITFLRPNPDADIDFGNSGGLVGGSQQTGKVILISPKGKTLTVDVESTGQISVQ
jgi:prepilin-type N-terminal cleavage/methylation domain-containing protein